MTVLDLANRPVIDFSFPLNPAEFAMRGRPQPLYQLVDGHHGEKDDAGKPAPLESVCADFPALSDERQAGHPQPLMDAKKTVAANLNAWMAHAMDSGGQGGSVKGLSLLSKVSRPTIDDIRAARGACGVDTLAKIAAIYGLTAWQMLVPGNKPPWKPKLADETALEDEVKRRAEERVAEMIRAGEALKYGQTQVGSGERDVEDAIASRATAKGKSQRKAGAAKGASQKTQPSGRTGKPISGRRVTAKVQ